MLRNPKGRAQKRRCKERVLREAGVHVGKERDVWGAEKRRKVILQRGERACKYKKGTD